MKIARGVCAPAKVRNDYAAGKCGPDEHSTGGSKEGL